MSLLRMKTLIKFGGLSKFSSPHILSLYSLWSHTWTYSIMKRIFGNYTYEILPVERCTHDRPIKEMKCKISFCQCFPFFCGWENSSFLLENLNRNCILLVPLFYTQTFQFILWTSFFAYVLYWNIYLFNTNQWVLWI